MAEVNVRGLQDLKRILEAFPVKVEKNIMRGAVRAGAKLVQQEAKSNARVLSGQMRNGIKIGTNSRGGKVTATVRARGPHGYLALFHEYGTVKMRAHPFMRPALDSQANSAVVAAGNYIKSRLSTKFGLETPYITVEGDE